MKDGAVPACEGAASGRSRRRVPGGGAGGWGQGMQVAAGGDRVGRRSGHESGPGLRL